MTPEFYICDGCNKKCPKEQRIFVVTDRVMDAAGSREDEGKYVDVCGVCAFNALNFLYLHRENRLPNHENGIKFLKYIKERKSK